MRDRKISDRDFKKILKAIPIIQENMGLILYYLEGEKPNEHKILSEALKILDENGINYMVSRIKK